MPPGYVGMHGRAIPLERCILADHPEGVMIRDWDFRPVVDEDFAKILRLVI